VRRLAVKLHLWLGLTVGLLWALQGLSGASLVFHREFDRWAHPERAGSVGPMASLDALVAAATEAGGAAPKRISVVDTRPDLVMADYDGLDGTPRQLFLDAATARVVGERLYSPAAPGSGATSRFLYNLHERLTAGDTGEIIIGSSGLILFSSLALGLWIGWPRVWRGVAKIRSWRSRAQKLYGWHRLVGLSAGFALLLVVPGGIYMIFSEPIRNAAAAVMPHKLPYKPAPLPEGAPTLWIAPQAAFEAAAARFPEASFVRLAIPSAKAPVYAVRLLQPDEVRAWSGTTTVTVDAHSGAVLDVYDPLTAPLSNRIGDAAFSIHNGEIAGTIGRLLVMLAGLSLPTFYVTGVWLWLAKRRRSAAARLAAAE
jgi:uncharacterized iron-regulated membrane protein